MEENNFCPFSQVVKMGATTSAPNATQVSRNPDVMDNFHNISYNWAPDDYGQHSWDSGLANFITTKTIISIVSSAVCIVLNSLLVFFIFSHSEFRDWKFYPTAIQALADVIGPGIGNLWYEWLVYEQLQLRIKQAIEIDVPLTLNTLQAVTQLKNFSSCVLSLLRIVVNEYTTGPCVLATAFVRYALVVHPTKNLVRKWVLVSQVLIIVAIGVVSLVVKTLTTFHRVGSSTFNPYLSYWERIKDFDGLVYKECDDALYSRSQRVLWFELTFCLIIPALISGYFYAAVGLKLLQRGRDGSRNRNLTLAFFLSWVMWIVCWPPYYWGSSAEVFQTYDGDEGKEWYKNFDRTTFIGSINVFFTVSKRSIHMVYSHLNALIFIIVLKPFQKWLMNLPGNVLRFLLMKNHAADANMIVMKIQKIATWIVTVLIFIPCGSLLSASTITVFRVTNLQQSGLEMHDNSVHLWKWQTQNAMSHSDLNPTQFFDHIRFLCGENHAKLNFEWKRCFFVTPHLDKPRNLSEQIDLCRSKNAVMVYPREGYELSDIWNFYKAYQGWPGNPNLTRSDDWFLRLGFERKFRGVEFNYMFTSVDGKFNFTKDSFLDKLKSPAVCVTNLNQPCYRCAYTILECNRQTLQKHTMCAIDFSSNHQ